MKNAKSIFQAADDTYAQTQMSKTMEGRGWLMEDSLRGGCDGGVGEGLAGLHVLKSLFLGWCQVAAFRALSSSVRETGP